MSLSVASLARADVVSAVGRPIVVDVKVTALRDGQLLYYTSTGQKISRPVEQLRYLQISGWDTFNRAERQQRDGQIRLAIGSYEQCLREDETADDAAGVLDRGLLTRCRLIRLYELQGQFEPAVEAYLAVIEKMPAAVDVLRPTRLPRNDPRTIAAAAGKLDKAIAARDRLDPVAVSLEKWRATWPGAPGGNQPPLESRPEAGPLRIPTGVATRPAEVSAASHPMVAQVRSLVQNGRHEEALEHIAKAARSRHDASSELHYWQGQAYLGVGSRESQKERQAQQRRRAGLAFMRVAIQWPQSPLAAECLFRAGEICRQEGRADRAAALWTELLAVRPDATPWAARAREELGRLKVTETAPAR